MKAIRYCEYGSPDVLKFEDVEKPVPTDEQVLIKVRAASLNALDAYMIRDAWLNRLIFGLRKPRDTRLGRDVAGQVEAVGKNVTQFKPGDEVLGADHVIDYTKEDFTRSDQRYDVIFDNVCNHSFAERRRVLNPKGICVLAGMGGAGVKEGQAIGRIAGNLFTARGLSSFTDQKFAQYMTKMSKQDIIMLCDLTQAGKITPVIDRTYRLSDSTDALRYLGEGHARGKVVITVEQEQKVTMHEMKRTAGISADSDGRERSTMEGAGQLHCYCGPI